MAHPIQGSISDIDGGFAQETLRSSLLLMLGHAGGDEGSVIARLGPRGSHRQLAHVISTRFYPLVAAPKHGLRWSFGKRRVMGRGIRSG